MAQVTESTKQTLKPDDIVPETEVPLAQPLVEQTPEAVDEGNVGERDPEVAAEEADMEETDDVENEDMVDEDGEYQAEEEEDVEDEDEPSERRSLAEDPPNAQEEEREQKTAEEYDHESRKNSLSDENPAKSKHNAHVTMIPLPVRKHKPPTKPVHAAKGHSTIGRKIVTHDTEEKRTSSPSLVANGRGQPLQQRSEDGKRRGRQATVLTPHGLDEVQKKPYFPSTHDIRDVLCTQRNKLRDTSQNAMAPVTLPSLNSRPTSIWLKRHYGGKSAPSRSEGIPMSPQREVRTAKTSQSTKKPTTTSSTRTQAQKTPEAQSIVSRNSYPISCVRSQTVQPKPVKPLREHLVRQLKLQRDLHLRTTTLGLGLTKQKDYVEHISRPIQDTNLKKMIPQLAAQTRVTFDDVVVFGNVNWKETVRNVPVGRGVRA